MSIFKKIGIREGRDRINEEVVYNIARAYIHLDQQIAKLLAEYDLSPAKFNILLMVKHVGKNRGIAQNEISKLLLVTTSNITRMIDKLEKDGYVSRSSQEGDRRVNLISITKKGSDLLDKAWIPYKQKINDMVDKKCDKKNKTLLINLLSQIVG